MGRTNVSKSKSDTQSASEILKLNLLSYFGSYMVCVIASQPSRISWQSLDTSSSLSPGLSGMSEGVRAQRRTLESSQPAARMEQSADKLLEVKWLWGCDSLNRQLVGRGDTPSRTDWRVDMRWLMLTFLVSISGWASFSSNSATRRSCSMRLRLSVLEEAPKASANLRSTLPRRTWSRMGWPQLCRYFMRNWKVRLERVTLYLQLWNADTVGSLRISAGVWMGVSCRMKLANSALPKNVDWWRLWNFWANWRWPQETNSK